MSSSHTPPPPMAPFTNQISIGRWAKFLFACGVFALCVRVLASMGYSCSFTHLNAAIKSQNISDFMTADSMCNQVFGHPCGQQNQFGGTPSRNLDAAIAKWSNILKGYVTFACN